MKDKRKRKKKFTTCVITYLLSLKHAIKANRSIEPKQEENENDQRGTFDQKSLAFVYVSCRRKLVRESGGGANETRPFLYIFASNSAKQAGEFSSRDSGLGTRTNNLAGVSFVTCFFSALQNIRNYAFSATRFERFYVWCTVA